MSNFVTKEQRERLPEWMFGIPEKRLLIVSSQDDIYKAPSRLASYRGDKEAIKKRMITAALKQGFKLPATWAAELSRAASTMSANASVSFSGGASDANAGDGDNGLSGAVDDATLYAQAVNEKRPTRSPRAADPDEADYVKEAREQAERFAELRNQQRNRISER